MIAPGVAGFWAQDALIVGEAVFPDHEDVVIGGQHLWLLAEYS